MENKGLLTFGKWRKEEIVCMFPSEINRVVYYCFGEDADKSKRGIDYTKSLDRTLRLEEAIRKHHLESEYIDALLEVFKYEDIKPDIFAFMHARPSFRCKAFCLVALGLIERKEKEVLNLEEDDDI